MELELDFFQAAVKDAKQPRIGLLVLDFDETLSVSDTTSVIIDNAISRAEAASTGKPMRPSMHCHECVYRPLPICSLGLTPTFHAVLLSFPRQRSPGKAMLLLTSMYSNITDAMAEVGSMPFMMQGLRMVQQLDLSWRRRGTSWSATMCSSEMNS